MNDTMIRARLHRIAVDELDWDGADLPDGPISDRFDSLQLMTLIVAVEDEYQIALEPKDEETIVTVDDLVAVIREKQNA